jgi:hypothetical protein
VQTRDQALRELESRKWVVWESYFLKDGGTVIKVEGGKEMLVAEFL